MRALLLPLLLLLPALRAAAQRTETFDLDRTTGSKIEITSVIHPPPPTGFAPIHIRITNNTDAEITIPLNTLSQADNHTGGSHTLRSSFSLTAPPRKTTDRELTVPLSPMAQSSGRGGSGSLTLTARTPLGSQNASFDTGGQPDIPYPIYSQQLARRSLPDIGMKIASAVTTGYSSGAYGEYSAGLYSAAQLPSDWRGLAGVDVLSISSDEWTALPPGRTAVLQWIKLGGTLDLYRKAGAPPPAQTGLLPEGRTAMQDGTPVGAGLGARIPMDGEELKASAAHAIVEAKGGLPIRRKEYTNALQEEQSTFYTALGKKDFAAGQVGLTAHLRHPCGAGESLHLRPRGTPAPALLHHAHHFRSRRAHPAAGDLFPGRHRRRRPPHGHCLSRMPQTITPTSTSSRSPAPACSSAADSPPARLPLSPRRCCPPPAGRGSKAASTTPTATPAAAASAAMRRTST